MFANLLTGIGYGLGFWGMAIPMMFLIKWSNSRQPNANDESIELMRERNEIDNVKVSMLRGIRDELIEARTARDDGR